MNEIFTSTLFFLVQNLLMNTRVVRKVLWSETIKTVGNKHFFISYPLNTPHGEKCLILVCGSIFGKHRGKLTLVYHWGIDKYQNRELVTVGIYNQIRSFFSVLETDRSRTAPDLWGSRVSLSDFKSFVTLLEL